VSELPDTISVRGVKGSTTAMGDASMPGKDMRWEEIHSKVIECIQAGILQWFKIPTKFMRIELKISENGNWNAIHSNNGITKYFR